MKTFYYAALAVCFFLMSGCSDEESILSTKDADLMASMRSDNSLSITITLANHDTLYLYVAKFFAVNVDGNGFLLTTNPGLPNELSYYAIAASICEIQSQLKVVIDPGLSQTIYNDRHTLTLIGDEEDGIQVNINQGDIILNATAVIGEDNEGI